MSELLLLEILAVLSFLLLVAGVVMIFDARKGARFVRRMEETSEWNPGPMLTEAEIKEFHAMRWDGD